MTIKDRARVARLTPKIEALFDKYAEVFTVELSGEKHINAKIDI